MTFIPGPVNQPGTKVAQTTVKAANPTNGQVAPPADQFELYNATVDPAELTNLYGNPNYAATQAAAGEAPRGAARRQAPHPRAAAVGRRIDAAVPVHPELATRHETPGRCRSSRAPRSAMRRGARSAARDRHPD